MCSNTSTYTKSCFRKLRASLNISTCTFILMPTIKYYCKDIPAICTPTLVQCWTTVYSAGPTLNRCFVFTEIHDQRLVINYWLLRAFRRHWRQIHLFTGVSVNLTCQILITFMSDGSVLQGQITKIPISCELSTITFLTLEMLSFNLVYNT